MSAVRVRVKNLGDIPLYIKTMYPQPVTELLSPQVISEPELYVDGVRVPSLVCWWAERAAHRVVAGKLLSSVLKPGESKVLTIEIVFFGGCPIDPFKDHVVEVIFANTTAKYPIPKAELDSKIVAASWL